jgi:hypothetical protein
MYYSVEHCIIKLCDNHGKYFWTLHSLKAEDLAVGKVVGIVTYKILTSYSPSI